MENNADTFNIDIDTIDINIDIDINDIDYIDIDMNPIDLSNLKKSIFDENFICSKVDRNNMLMSSYFACTHVFDPNFVNLLSEIIENAKKHRFHQFLIDKKLIDRSIDDTQKLMCDTVSTYQAK